MQIKSYFWKRQHKSVVRSLPYLSEPGLETSAGTIDGVNQGQTQSLDTSSSSSASW